nr:hypothetical protein BaRGS_027604 [Batillaria attramentaria]
MSTAYPAYQGEGSPRFGRRPDAGSRAPAHNSTTSAWSTTSYSETRSEDQNVGYTDVSYSHRDVTNVSRDVNYSHKDTSYSHRDVTFSRRGDTSSENTDGPTSYDFFYGPDQKVEWSCDAAGGCQKLSFLLLVVAFLGHGIAVSTPYYVIGWTGDQMVLHEGVWLSCYREEGVGRWICGTYDYIRNEFEEPPLCSFLSFVIFGACYPYHQGLAGQVSLSYSYVLQILSFLVLVLSLAAHLRESYPSLKVWENKMCATNGLPKPNMTSCAGGRSVELPRLPKAQAPKVTASQPSTTKSSGRFALPKFPSALSRFRSKGGSSSDAREETPGQRDVEREPTSRQEKERARDTADGSPRMQALQVPTRSGEKSSYRSYAASNDSLSGYDSQV